MLPAALPKEPLLPFCSCFFSYPWGLLLWVVLSSILSSVKPIFQFSSLRDDEHDASNEEQPKEDEAAASCRASLPFGTGLDVVLFGLMSAQHLVHPVSPTGHIVAFGGFVNAVLLGGVPVVIYPEKYVLVEGQDSDDAVGDGIADEVYHEVLVV